MGLVGVSLEIQNPEPDLSSPGAFIQDEVTFPKKTVQKFSF